jgi:hypothetical protein
MAYRKGMAKTNRYVLLIQDQTPVWCESFTPDQWMRTVIKELWAFSIAIWKQRNAELRGGTDGAISMEQRRKETAANRGCGSVPG